MANKRYVVELAAEERDHLHALLKQKGVIGKKRMRAEILLKVDEGEWGPCWTHARVAEFVEVHVNTITCIVRKLVEDGFEAAITRKKHRRPGRDHVIAGKVEETLLALATGDPPQGYAHWTLRLLADRLVHLQVVDSISHETVRKALKKTTSQCIRWRSG